MPPSGWTRSWERPCVVLIDTGALYALADRNDANHHQALQTFDSLNPDESVVVTLPILTEACWMLQERLGRSSEQTLWEDVVHGVFHVYQLDLADMARALEIERQFDAAAFGFTDACSLAATERMAIDIVFTFDRRDFTIYRTPKGAALRLIP